MKVVVQRHRLTKMLKLNHEICTEGCFLSCYLPLYHQELHRRRFRRVAQFSAIEEAALGKTRYTWEGRESTPENVKPFIKVTGHIKNIPECHHINISLIQKVYLHQFPATKYFELSCISQIDVEFLTSGQPLEYDLI